MKLLIQRVDQAQVTVSDKVVGAINKGLLVFIGVEEFDTVEIADKMIHKLLHLRIFEDDNGKTNLDIKTVGGSLLYVSQFTLCADCRKGNRPSFIGAALPDLAIPIYQHMIHVSQKVIPQVEAGEFGADMKVSLVNNGPFTITLDSKDIVKTQ